MIRQEVERFCQLKVQAAGVDWQALFSVKGIDYKGDEVRVARWIRWEMLGEHFTRVAGGDRSCPTP